MRAHEFGGGWLELIVGPMFGGKSEELIRRVNRALIARQRVQVFKPAIDEGQFLDSGLVALALELAHAGTRVLIAGLDLVFRGEPFGPTPALLAHADVVEKLTAISSCGRAATRTQRLIAGHPAHIDDPIVLVGAAERDGPRCRACHTVVRSARLMLLLDLAR